MSIMVHIKLAMQDANEVDFQERIFLHRRWLWPTGWFLPTGADQRTRWLGAHKPHAWLEFKVLHDSTGWQIEMALKVSRLHVRYQEVMKTDLTFLPNLVLKMMGLSPELRRHKFGRVYTGSMFMLCVMYGIWKIYFHIDQHGLNLMKVSCLKNQWGHWPFLSTVLQTRGLYVSADWTGYPHSHFAINESVFVDIQQ